MLHCYARDHPQSGLFRSQARRLPITDDVSDTATLLLPYLNRDLAVIRLRVLCVLIVSTMQIIEGYIRAHLWPETGSDSSTQVSRRVLRDQSYPIHCYHAPKALHRPQICVLHLSIIRTNGLLKGRVKGADPRQYNRELKNTSTSEDR
ncbi:hypothetical protein NDU88_006230 [Pleurodeles waltl]|uniref:Uncharacterized protein n=1 Tax=Pleurodeles waltl TaxID=8319 RepID=A0AAV7NPP0_PLEWA|nr:hypothetical protein NDU88_006230 [Pleurodeles waltl]